MGYERYPRDDDRQDYGRDYGSGRDDSYSSARDYGTAGQYGNRDRERQGYGSRDYGNQRYAQRDQYQGGGTAGGRDYYGGQGGYGRDAVSRQDRDQAGRYDSQSDGRYGERQRYGADAGRDAPREYHGSYGSGSRPFEDFGSRKHADDDNYRSDRGSRPASYGRPQGQQGYGRQPQGYDYEDRGFLARAGDEVRSWFGDEDAERRREYDSRMDDRYDTDRDNDYHSWRRGQIQSLDRDYDEYRRENRTKFENEFGSWRSTRQTQRDSLNSVEEHMDVVGSDGEHVGTVDKVRGDRILLTKNDVDAGGRHHSIPSSWLQTVDGKVTLSKTAAEAKKAWRDEERNQAMFGDEGNDRARYGQTTGSDATTRSSAGAASTGTSGASSTTATTGDEGKTLNRSFSGTY
ncbi:DUF2171 domain-containing protein [Sphingomonas sp. A2-49]|uniref:DUF2171 domain-containing protein n=1 Tax=Sphingomonas sp. A2-49 TaxID=1391375 RepID=UPI0021D2FB60|nr:DUF2171 domain-containing protein [Sphingomonas sp. A2-49]MCU6455391.1 DUF2171 domain-containing protein [Sphingomonas sp. A2-49]